MDRTLRTDETENRYKEFISKGLLNNGCVLCKGVPMKEFSHWKVLLNDFPYDKIAEIHHMIVTKRHVHNKELNTEEKEEFELIKNGYLSETYDYIIEATRKKKSIPEHAHIHLIVAKS